MKSIIPSFEDAVSFHGHSCPGLAYGYQAAVCALNTLFSDRAEDEEIVAIVENDACGVDAIQVVTGCTIGKGNLIYKDLGKNAWSFILRDNSKAIRIVTKPDEGMAGDPEIATIRQKVFSGQATPDEDKKFHQMMEKQTLDILTKKPDELFTIQEINPDIPEKARIFESIACSGCGEMTAEHRIRIFNGKPVCLTCNQEYGRGW